jgi:alkylhydroperoxidase family enzyme
MTKASIAPLTLDQLPIETRQSLEFAQKLMGFVPNDALVMARWPELLRAMQQLVAVIYQPRHIEPGLKRLLALMVSAAAGCRYCQAHTAHGADHQC